MKKSLIGILSLGLVIGVGTVGVKSFANEREVGTQSFTSNVNSVTSNIEQNAYNKGEVSFKVLNQETNKFETLDDNNYSNNNANYGQGCCEYMSNGSYKDTNTNQYQ